ncbi:MAG TPA: DUF5939 domain-containing protein [Chroococcales cyanobacterium]|jgi:class 3 adenylate cyclase
MNTLAKRIEALSGEPKALLDFKRFIEEGKEEELYKVNPLIYAREHGISERAAIELFVAAAHAGLFEFSWEVLCPGCGFALVSKRALCELESQSHCSVCEIDVEAVLDEAIEVSFTVAPSTRPIRYHKPEELMEFPDLLRVLISANRVIHPDFQKMIDSCMRGFGIAQPRETHFCQTSLEEGGFRFASLTHHLTTRLDVEGEPTTEEQPLLAEIRDEVLMLSAAALRPGPVKLEIRNFTGDRTIWQLFFKPEISFCELPSEMKTRFIPYLTGKRLLSNQVFRDLYRTETIAPEGSFSLRALTILFTDLKGSTALYERIGDLNAYRLVREHFKILSQAVAENEGAVVKTIGDAIMATFPQPHLALAATVRMHKRLAEWNEKNGADDLTLKVGIHEGPCIAVNSNDKVDYFGQTVNMAARIQGLAGSEETFFSEAVYRVPGLAEMTEKLGFTLRPETVKLKGITEEAKVYRALLKA